jgi:hypothetical protein
MLSAIKWFPPPRLSENGKPERPHDFLMVKLSKSAVNYGC